MDRETESDSKVMKFVGRVNSQSLSWYLSTSARVVAALLVLPPCLCIAQSGSKFTPDPYFGRSSVGQAEKSAGGDQVRSLLPGSDWDPPSTTASDSNQVETEISLTPPETNPPAAIAWEPPITNVTPMAAKAAPSSASTPPTRSIIRENEAASLEQPDLVAPEAPIAGKITNPYAADNDFLASPPESNNFDAQPESPSNKSFTVIDDENSFAPTSNGLPKSAAQRSARVSDPAANRPQVSSANAFSIEAPGDLGDGETFGRSGAGSETRAQQATNDASSPSVNGEPFAASELLAKVGSEPIFAGDLLFEINQMIEKVMPGAPESAKEIQRQKLVKRMLPKFVDQKLLYVGMLDLLPKEADLDDIVRQAAKEFDKKALPEMLKKAGVQQPEELDEKLRELGSSLRKLRDTWSRDQLTRYFLSQELDEDQEITHQQLLDEYRDNLDFYAVKARARWEQIMVRFDRFDSRQEARARIVELGDQLVYGANFEALAKKDSHGFRASQGGQHDWTGKDALVLKELDKAIFSLPIGELSDIIETRDGLHIVRVKERQNAGRKPFSEAQVEIKKRIAEKNRNKVFDEYLAKLRDRIPVEYYR